MHIPNNRMRNGTTKDTNRSSFGRLVRVVVAFVVAVHVFEIIDPILEPTPTIVP